MANAFSVLRSFYLARSHKDFPRNTVLAFKYRFMIHFKALFVYGMR